MPDCPHCGLLLDLGICPRCVVDDPTGWTEEDSALALDLDSLVRGVVERERSCFTCRHDFVMGTIHGCRSLNPDDCTRAASVYRYAVNSGANESPDGLPTDRTIACPGWAAKETT